MVHGQVPRTVQADEKEVVIIATYALHLVCGINGNKQFASASASALMDIDNLAALVNGDDGINAPRLEPPLRILGNNDAKIGGKFTAVALQSH